MVFIFISLMRVRRYSFSFSREFEPARCYSDFRCRISSLRFRTSSCTANTRSHSHSLLVRFHTFSGYDFFAIALAFVDIPTLPHRRRSHGSSRLLKSFVLTTSHVLYYHRGNRCPHWQRLGFVIGPRGAKGVGERLVPFAAAMLVGVGLLAGGLDHCAREQR